MKPYAPSFIQRRVEYEIVGSDKTVKSKETKRNWRQLQVLDLVIKVAKMDNPSGKDQYTFAMN